LKSFPELLRKHGRILLLAAVLTIVTVAIATADDALPSWMQFAEAGSRIENALFRSMPLPGGAVLARRPPSEGGPLIDELLRAEPHNAELYSLRALQDEQRLDFAAAEKDWKLYTEHAKDRIGAQFTLADFYHRRVRPADEIQALAAIAESPSGPGEEFIAPQQQRSWRAFERIFSLIAANALPAGLAAAKYRTWVERYPRESEAYARYFNFLLAQKHFEKASSLLAQYAQAFPQDAVFGVKARALLEYRRGNVEQGLAVYERSFEPLWPKELVQSFFDLLRETQNLRKFLDQSRAALRTNPNDLKAAARVFYYYQQDGKSDAALQVLAEFRQHKEDAHIPWKSEELYTLARLCEDSQAYPEAARYYFALYNSSGAPDARERALSGLAGILLTAPEQPLQLGAGDLSLYKDVATADANPGFLNGIVSLLLNSKSPRTSFAEEEQRAVPYFHRSRAAELVALLDQQFPNSAQRPALHARLIQVYADYGQSEVVIRQGRQFLEKFPNAVERTQVLLLIADAYERLNQPDAEFAIYDAVLKELAERAHHVPMGSGDNAASSTIEQAESPANSSEEMDNASGDSTQQLAARKPQRQAFFLRNTTPAHDSQSSEAGYENVLDRYLSRLTSLKRLPQALEVLRHELDRNPNDPGLYEKLAQFLQQNQLDAKIEEVYRRAMQQFPDRSWYHKLAHYYIRQRRDSDLDELTQQVVRIFSGTELESYFQEAVIGSGPHLYLQFNLYAAHRFPHDLAFVRNLLYAYRAPETRDDAARDALLRQHWFEADDLRDHFFEALSASGRLEQELAALEAAEPAIHKGNWDDAARANPVAVQFYAEAELWRSHFEGSLLALGNLAAQYPADFDIGRRASAVFRSLAYVDAKNTEYAVHIEQNLLQADPGNRDTLARIGDIYADRELFSEAAPYWESMAEIEPGKPDSFVQSATVFWDYYRFEDALRILNEGRKKLGNETLFGYEEGAIYENERDYARAVAEYAKAAIAGGENSSSELRLLELARRRKLRSVVDAATRLSPQDGEPPLAAIRLRVRVLDAQDRKLEVKTLLAGGLQNTTSLELVQNIESLAQKESLEAVREQAIDRQASLTSDPVLRLQLRYRLVQFYEGKKDFASAQHNVEALYKENPKILGVVRSTVDFYWRRNMRQRAVDVLMQAAKDSYPELGRKFNFEAARKSTEAGNYTLACQLLDGLLQESQYDAELFAAMADTYARASDNAGLRDFYLAKIELLRKAPLSQDERVERVAALRRGLIPALLRLKDYSGAVDQYMELINHYPEDQNLVAEAALAAGKHDLAAKLVAFYEKTVADSPRDYRWGLVLARIQTSLENYPAALDAYAKAIALRPDRADLFTARADLFERLGRSDEAAADYEKLYELSYHDTKWMQKVAQVRARQGKVDDTVRALKVAFIEGRPVSPENFFEAAKSLEGWGMLPQARDFAQQGVDAAGKELLADAAHHEGAELYVRVMTRLRRQDEAFTLLTKAFGAASDPTSFFLIVRQVEKQGIAAVTDKEWREREFLRRQGEAHTSRAACMRTMGETAALYFTPEEKTSFQALLEAKRKGIDFRDLGDFLVPAAESAGLAALEAQWRYEIVLSSPESSGPDISRLVELQSQRLQFSELGHQMEAIAAAVPANQRGFSLSQAFEAYRSDEDAESQLRVLTALDRRDGLSGEQLDRYFKLLLARQPESLIAFAANGSEFRRDAVANFAVANTAPQFAYQVLEARAKRRPAVWSPAYLGLAGLYFGDGDARVSGAFLQALGDATIGDRIGRPVDRERHLAGDIWFYYGSRYGEYLGAMHKRNAEDYLPAELERTPGDAEVYLESAQNYLEIGDDAGAVAEYQRALELAPQRVIVHDQLAEIYWKQGNKALAIAEWKRALALLEKEQDQRVPESFWPDFVTLMTQLRQRGLAAQFKPEVEKLLRTYVRRNDAYSASSLLRSAYLFAGGGAASTGWLLEVCNSAKEPESTLGAVVDARWLAIEEKGPVFQRILEIKKARAEKTHGEERVEATSNLHFWQDRWIVSLIQARQYTRASELVTSFAPAWIAEGTTVRGEIVPRQIEIAGGLHNLGPVLQGLRAQPETTPLATLITIARSLDGAGLKTESRELLEFAYSRAIEDHDLSAPNFLGLAEVRVASGNLSGALELLRRLTLVVGQPGENLSSAAAVLEKTGHPMEASAFLQQLVNAEPWNFRARLRLEKDRLASGKEAVPARKALTAIASTTDVSYQTRVAAAEGLGGAGTASDFGSRELNLLASGKAISTADADQPFFISAREKAARARESESRRINLLRAALRNGSNGNSTRISLFFAAVDAHQYSLAVADLQPLLRKGFLNETYRNPAREAEEADAAERGAENQAEHEQAELEQNEGFQNEADASDDAETQLQPNAPIFVSVAEKTHIAASLALSEERLGHLGAAMQHFQIAERLETNADRRKLAHRNFVRVSAEIDRQAKDAARRPVIHNALEQDRVVRPRLVAFADVPKTAAASEEGKQP
jgi:tetratricopeptide (TPR) repeat protein/predicted Zn-dependent protease